MGYYGGYRRRSLRNWRSRAKHLRGSLLVVLGTVLAFLPPLAFGNFKECPHFFPGAKPNVKAAAPGKHREMCFSAFAVLHSGQSKTPIYVAQRLTRVSIKQAQGEQRADNFYEEARLPAADRSRLQDYKSSTSDAKRFDRGHMAPAADMHDAQAMAQSFSLANIVPQAPQNNRKAWASIEKATRKFVSRAQGDVFVITGPVFSGQVETLGVGQVWIPKYLFKLVYDSSSNRAWAHWLENKDEAPVSRPISYSELVRRTGTEYLPGVTPQD